MLRTAHASRSEPHAATISPRQHGNFSCILVRRVSITSKCRRGADKHFPTYHVKLKSLTWSTYSPSSIKAECSLPCSQQPATLFRTHPRNIRLFSCHYSLRGAAVHLMHNGCGWLLFKYTHYTRVGTSIVATIYLQLIQNRYMFRSFTVLQCSHQHCVQPIASDLEVVGYL